MRVTFWRRLAAAVAVVVGVGVGASTPPASAQAPHHKVVKAVTAVNGMHVMCGGCDWWW
jgi:hypothetical protein